MKSFKFEYLFYLVTVSCFCFVLYSVVSQSPNVLPPKEYVYVYEDDSNGDTVGAESEINQAVSSKDTTSDSVNSSQASKGTSSKRPPQNKPAVIPQSTPIKQYVSSQKTSSAASKASSSKIQSEKESSIPESDSAESDEERPEKPSKPTSKPEVDDTSIVNINTATQAELMTLSGIGEVLSLRIIEMRDSIGGFNSIDELMLVPGIGEKSFSKISARLTV